MAIRLAFWIAGESEEEDWKRDKKLRPQWSEVGVSGNRTTPASTAWTDRCTHYVPKTPYLKVVGIKPPAKCFRVRSTNTPYLKVVGISLGFDFVEWSLAVVPIPRLGQQIWPKNKYYRADYAAKPTSTSDSRISKLAFYFLTFQRFSVFCEFCDDKSKVKSKT